MVQIIEENESPSLGSRLAGAFSNLGQQGSRAFSDIMVQRQRNKLAEQQEKMENEQIKSNYGIDLSGIRDPKTRELILAEKLKGQSNKQGHGIEGAVKALNRMESLIGQKGIGLINSKMDLGSKAWRNQGEFESLQAAILPIFKSFFPRGMTEKEFKFVNDRYMPQIGDSEAKIQGKLDGLRQLLSDQGIDISSGSMMNMGMNQQEEQAIPMRDSSGNIYDIPPHLYEKARAKGLK